MATRLHAKNGNGCSNEVQMRETMRALPVREQTVRRAKREAQAFPETWKGESEVDRDARLSGGTNQPSLHSYS